MQDLGTFVRVADLGSFAAVASETGQASSSVSRAVTRLEERLGVALFHRSTRSLSLTPEGGLFLDRARDILKDLEEAEGAVAAGRAAPRGTVRINTGTAIARLKLVPALTDFMAAYPEIRIDLSVTDRRVDPIAERIDVAIRVGPLVDSDLVAIRLGEVRRVIAAAPRYLEARGTPSRPADLLDHDCLLLSGFDHLGRWPFHENGRHISLAVTGPFRSDNAELLIDMALAGAGIVRFGDFLGAAALRDGRLTRLLVDTHDPDPRPITALVPPGRQSLPRVRLLLDHLKRAFASVDA